MASNENENLDIHQHKDDENHAKQPVDRFSKFFFGERNVGTKLNSFNPNQESESTKEEIDWFLGRPINKHSKNLLHNHFQQYPQNETIENLLNNINLMELMEQIDSFITAAKQFKPLYKDVKGALGKLLTKD